MAYRRRRNSSSYTNWGRYHFSQRALVSAKYGGIDEDVRTAFFNLTPATLEDFFSHYKRKFGPSAAAYAKKTYDSWKSGKTAPSAQTSERLLETLPTFLPLSVKCDLLRKLREHYRSPESHNLTVSAYAWREPIKPLVERLIHRAYTAELPESVESRLDWLSSGSMQATKALLKEAEAIAAKNTVAYLEREFQNIERLLSVPSNKLVTHTISLPYGTIRVTINRSAKMANPNDDPRRDLVPQDNNTSLERQTPGSLLQNALKNLDPEQVRKISETAAEQAVNLEVEKVRAERRYQNASRDMDEFVEQAGKLDRSLASDYRMQGDFETASGRTNVQVSKSSSKVTVIIAVIIGIVLLLLFASRN
jgi:hypothetical protein